MANIFQRRKRVLSTVSSSVQTDARRLLTDHQIRYTMQVKDRNGNVPGDVYEYNVYVAAKKYVEAAHVLMGTDTTEPAPEPEEPAQEV